MPQGYKTFFVFNSAEHEFFPAYKQQITDEYSFLLNLVGICREISAHLSWARKKVSVPRGHIHKGFRMGL